MIERLREMLARYNPKPPPPVRQEDHDELDAAKAEHKRILGRADEAVREAMAHADEVFKSSKPRGRQHR